MAANPSTNQVEHFRKKNIDLFNGCSICDNQFMPGIIFKVSALISSSLPPHPHYFQDESYSVQHMIVGWNGHMQKFFIPYWISYLDESMSVWMNNFTCLGFVFCSCESLQKGNEYHTICCS